MKKNFIIIMALVLFLTLTGCGIEKNNSNTKKSTENFAVEFLKMENNNKNMIYSPLSIKYALKMLNEGAASETKDEIDSVIGKLDIKKYRNIDGVLSLANAAYIRDTYRENIKTEFVNNLTEKYDAEINYDKFENANNINKFINDKTFGIIKRLIDDSTVQNANTQMVLINALAIDMKWASKFAASDTSGQEFTLANGNKVAAAMMHQHGRREDDASFYKDDKITVLTMDLDRYDSTQLEFMAIMPNGSLSEYIKTFEVSEINNIKQKSTLAADTADGIDIAFPRFDFEYSLNLKEDLMNLGIKKAFDGKDADFTNMTTNPSGLFVSDALHKAKIETSEEGVKAAAVTAFVMEAKAILPKSEPVKITIDKPFLFVISDKDSGEIWFVGTVYEPTLWENLKGKY